MSTTLNLLLVKHQATSLSLTEVREQYFPSIKTDKYLRTLINKGAINLRTFKQYESRLAEHRVQLQDLADYLDNQAKTAA